MHYAEADKVGNFFYEVDFFGTCQRGIVGIAGIHCGIEAVPFYANVSFDWVIVIRREVICPLRSLYLVYFEETDLLLSLQMFGP